jgi:hypothetical protein
MRSMFTIVPTLMGISLSTAAMASNIGYSLADSTGTLSVTTPLSSWWANGTSTANASAGGTIGGTPGGNFVGGFSSLTPNWSGTLGANGTTLTAAAATPATAPTPTAASEPYYPLGFWNAGKPGGAVINIPTAGYFNIAKNNGVGSASFTNTVGNSAISSSATWAWAPGGFSADWTGTETASVGKVAKAGAALPANTRAVADVSDPIYLYVAYDDEPLTFQVALANLLLDVASDPQMADAYYDWSVQFGAGEIAGENVLFSDNGGQDFSTPGSYSLNPGTVVNFSNSTLSTGVYWLTADLNVGAEATTPEPATAGLIGGCLLLLGALLRRRRVRSAAL